MHSSGMRTVRSSTRLLGGGSASVHAGIHPMGLGLDTPLGLGLDTPLGRHPIRPGPGNPPCEQNDR